MEFGDAAREMAAYCRALWERRLVSGTSGNLSVRLRNGDLLVTPSGRSLRDLRADELVRTDAGGAPREAGLRPSSEVALHAAAYAARPDARAVVHAHPTFCVVWSRYGIPLPCDTVGARETLGAVAWTPYLPPGSPELAHAVAEQFATGTDAVLMASHGLSTVGSTLEHAFVLADAAEEAARVAYFRKAHLAYFKKSFRRL
jgi:L-fuculose-phosphate aldolase